MTIFDSDKNLQFVLRKLKNIIALEMRGMILKDINFYLHIKI